MPHRHVAVLLIALFAFPACRLDAPLFQHGPDATVTSLTMKCFLDSSRKNSTVCQPIAKWSDGEYEGGVAVYSAWDSSNAAVASTPPCVDQGVPVYVDRTKRPSGCGIVTHVATGTTEIRATFGGVTTSTRLDVVFIPD